MGPSLVSLMRLSDVPLPAPGSPAPPLQRPSRPRVRTAEVVREVDCITSHMTQLQEQEKGRRREKRANGNESKAQREGLRAMLRAEMGVLEERGQRDKERTDGLLEQQRGHRTRSLVDHVERHSSSTYWPYESRRLGPPRLTGSEYQQSLDMHMLLQNEQRLAALAEQMEPPKDQFLATVLLAQPRRLSKFEPEARTAARCEQVLRQAELRQLALESAAPGGSQVQVVAEQQRAEFRARLKQERSKDELKAALQVHRLVERRLCI